MEIVRLDVELAPKVLALMELGEPYIRARTPSDYWLYARLFSSTCPVALVDNSLAGAVIAFRSQDHPDEVYIQDVMTHPEHRRTGVTRALIGDVRARAAEWGCSRVYLTSEPENVAGHVTWTALGFTNVPGDYVVSDVVSVIADYKGPGKDRSVYELDPRTGG